MHVLSYACAKLCQMTRPHIHVCTYEGISECTPLATFVHPRAGVELQSVSTAPAGKASLGRPSLAPAGKAGLGTSLLRLSSRLYGISDITGSKKRCHFRDLRHLEHTLRLQIVLPHILFCVLFRSKLFGRGMDSE